MHSQCFLSLIVPACAGSYCRRAPGVRDRPTVQVRQTAAKGEVIVRSRIACVAIAAVAAGLLVLTAFSKDERQYEQYSAVWARTGSPAGGATVLVDIRIDKYTTDDEMKGYATLLVEGGEDKLVRALEKLDVGQISPSGRLGIPLAIARKFINGDKTIIRLATTRDMGFLELRRSGRSVDYPYTIIQLELDQKGNGMGSAICAAKVKFNKKNQTYEIESLQHGSDYNKIMNVRKLK